MSRRSVQSGACMANGNGLCALQWSDCPESTAFVASRLLPTGQAHGGSCKDRYESEELAPLGTCGSDGNRCASDFSACTDPTTFVPANHENGCSTKVTLFGSCAGTCFWSSNDCWSGEQWSPLSVDCTCSRVVVGACLYSNHYWCAVSPEACDDPSEWISARDLSTRTDAPDCFLCRKKDDKSVKATPLPTSAPVSKPTPAVLTSNAVPVLSNANVNTMIPMNKESFGPDTAVVVISVVGTLLGTLLLTFLVLWLKRSSTRKTMDTASNIKIPKDAHHCRMDNAVDPSEPLSDDEEVAYH